LLRVVGSATILALKQCSSHLYRHWIQRDSLIDCCLTSNDRYFIHSQNEVRG
jgi:hypothetical protein